MPEEKQSSPYKDPRAYAPLAAQIAILAAIAWVGFRAGPGGQFSRSEAWLLIMVLMGAFAVVAGRGITGCWRGILINNNKRMSLSRLQLLAWTLLILSGILTAAITNEAFGSRAPLSIEIPSQLWVLMGIATASAVASPAVLSRKKDEKPKQEELNETAERLKTQSAVNVDKELSGVVIRNKSMADARWGDILMGDESGNAATVDVGKFQLFFFTFILVLAYAAAIGRMFDGAGAITALPAVDDSVNTLLGISHTGYLANKTVRYSREEEK